MDKINERCAVCGEPIEEDDEKVFCPDCGAPMHGDCYRMEGRCPNSDNHLPRRAAVPEQPEQPAPKPIPDFGSDSACGICGKPFTDDGEKVYCPECGAPMHRVCYNMTHSCPYADRHGATEDTAAAKDEPHTADENGVPLCGICGKPLYDHDEKVYCPDCGTPVHTECWKMSPECPNSRFHGTGFDWDASREKKTEKSSEPRRDNIGTGEEPDIDLRNINFESFPDMIMKNPIRSREDGEELTCHGVKQSELVHFLGLNNFSTPRFFTLFMKMANSGKVLSLNLSAWFFAPLYHFYRRMTGPAIILSLVTFVLMIPTMIMEVMYWSSPESVMVNSSLNSAATITSYIMIIVRVAILIFNDYIYMRWSVSKILALRERYKDADRDEYFAALEHRGNPRMMYVLGGMSLIMFLVYMLNIFISASGIVS